jgi:hypothetical protein
LGKGKVIVGHDAGGPGMECDKFEQPSPQLLS